MKYDAFISYRHADLDLYVAKKVHKALETFKVPRAVAKKTGKKNIKRVFRDQEELPIGSDLGDNIEAALSESEYLLVICSPRTPGSYWVQKEIDTFIKMHGREHVLAVLIEGEPDESFPPQLLCDEEGNPVEPLAADIRGASRQEMSRKMKTEIMRLAAPLLGCSYDDLKQRHRERKMKRMAAMAAVIAAFALAFGAYNAYNAALIQQNYEGKQRNQSKYLADTSLNLLEEGDRRAAVLVALEALPSEENDRPYVAEAQYALSEALYVYDTGSNMRMDRILSHNLPVDDFEFDLEGQRVVSRDQGGHVYVWNLADGKELAHIQPRIDENGYIVAVNKAVLYEDSILISENKTLRSVNFDGQEKWSVLRESTIGCEYNERTGIVACSNNTEVVFYDGKTGDVVGHMNNETPYSYTSCMRFSADNTKCAVTHLNDDETVAEGYISVYDFATGEISTVSTVTSFISDMDFDRENHLLAITNIFGDGLVNSEITGTDHIQKIDLKTGEILWSDTFPYQKAGVNAVASQIICRYYQDEAGMIHDEILASVDNTAYSWQNATGERMTEITVDGGIVTLMAAGEASYGYLAQRNGILEVVNMENATKYDASAVETGKEMRQAEIRNHTMVVRAYASPDLTVMKYPEYSDAEVVANLEHSIADMKMSPNKTYYAVKTYDYDAASNIIFYRTEDNELVSEWVEPEGYVELHGFVDDTTYVIATGRGEIMFYDIVSGEKETLQLSEELWSVEYGMNEEHSLLIACFNKRYVLIDLQKREILSEKETECLIFGVVLSGNGKTAYCNTDVAGLCILSVESGKLTPIDLEGNQLLQGFDLQEALVSSKDGNLVAISCSDGMIRVLDMQQKKTVAEIPFTGVRRRFMMFSEDNEQLILQGDDYYLRVYDINQQKFTYIAIGQYNEIKEMIADESSDTLCLITSADMIIVNKKDYERIAQIDGGMLFLPEMGKLYSSYYGTIYQFPYRTLEMLQQEAAEQFQGESLSELEKIKFRVE